MSQSTALYRTLGIVFVAAMSACTPRAARWTPASTGSATVIEVRNDQWDDLTVYLDRDGSLLRLGMVPGLSTKVLDVPADYLPRGGSVRLRATRHGSGVRAESVPFNMAQGQRAEWVAARTSGPTGVAVR
jgi:hypothetical protein